MLYITSINYTNISNIKKLIFLICLLLACLCLCVSVSLSLSTCQSVSICLSVSLLLCSSVAQATLNVIQSLLHPPKGD